MRIYFICPKKQSRSLKDAITENIRLFEGNGDTVYYPLRDTPKDLKTMEDLVEHEFEERLKADEIHVYEEIKHKGRSATIVCKCVIPKDDK
jgi:hypothetical protein